MADSELGELRRAPRIPLHRVERLIRAQSKGLAGGTNDSTFPAQNESILLGSSGDSGAEVVDAVPTWYADTFGLTSATTSPLTLTFVPIEKSEVVRLNGIVLTPGVDYTLTGAALALLDLTNLRLGIGAATWDLTVSYAYTDTAVEPFEASDFLTWVRNGDATLVGGTEVRLTQATSGQKGSIVCPDVIPSGWSEIVVDVSLYIPSVNGDGWEVILWDATQHTTNELDVYPGFLKRYLAAQVHRTRTPYFDQLFYSDDGAATISNSGGGITLNGDVRYTFVWTKTGANSASVQTFRNDGATATSPSDVWVPNTVYAGICAYTGGLFYNEHTVRAATITVT